VTDEYSPAAIDHFTAPRNVGTLDQPDGTGADANPSCGDRTTITLRIDGDRIVESRFRTFGCTAAIASASVLTELATGATVDAAGRIGVTDVLLALGGLPPRKEACALMAVGALRAAVIDARVRAAGSTA
jgi:NifU-like protein involved in Fe-S cluster formation